MLDPWLNQTVKVQRRAANPAKNSLNEPVYGLESGWTTVYASVPVRIEYLPEQVQWKETGERVNAGQQTFLYMNPQFILIPQDRITILQSDDINLVNKLYIVVAVFSEWDSMGNKHHNVGQIQIH